MVLPNLNDSASIATIAGTIIAIISAIFGAYKFRSRNSRQDKIEHRNITQSLEQGSQLIASEGGCITVNGNISSLPAVGHKTIPETLAKPSFSATQSGMQNGGYPHKTIYTIALQNDGGNVFNVAIKKGGAIIEKIATLRRSGKHTFDIDLTHRPNSLELFIECHDANGEARSQRLFGTKINEKYVFAD